MDNEISKKADSIKDEIIMWRRKIHENPEIGLNTPKTGKLIVQVLSDLGIEVRDRVGGFGVVGLLKGAKEPQKIQKSSANKVIALRADMDALPIQEETGVSYASKTPGVMHACGHDGHVAMLLGAAKILSAFRRQFEGEIKFIFQPGEEGEGGARLMIRDGALLDPKPNAIYGAHLGVLWPLKSGQVGVKSGACMAASDRFTIVIKGHPGHGATPHRTVDPIVAAAQVVLALQTIISRNVDPLAPAVVTVGTIQAGTASNIIPEDCKINGTVRYLDKSLGEMIKKRIEEISKGIAEAMGALARVEYKYGYPPVVNDKNAVDFLRKSASALLGSENVVDIAEPIMGGEDMSYYLEQIPGAFFGLGSGSPEKGTMYPHHHPKFNIDEEVLPKGSAIFAQLALDFLQE